MSEWHGCYDSSWSGLIVPGSFAHPAKFARNLINRIYAHAFEERWIRPGDTVFDPFGGVALGACDAIFMGLNWVGVELEDKFVELGRQNIELWRRKMRSLPNLGTTRIIQGDSRRLREIVKEAAIVISSPPFKGITPTAGDPNYDWKFHGDQSKYGTTPGNLANMRDRKLEAVISSPPFLQETKGAGIMKAGYTSRPDLGPDWVGKRTYAQDNIGKSPGQIGTQSGDTFWSASKDIVAGCYELLKPGGHAIWVVKAYVKGGKVVDFPGRWRSMCESIGFKLLHTHQAMLVKIHGEKVSFDRTVEEVRTERKSFFRRLAEKKGSPRIDFEEVQCFKKII